MGLGGGGGGAGAPPAEQQEQQGQQDVRAGESGPRDGQDQHHTAAGGTEPAAGEPEE